MKRFLFFGLLLLNFSLTVNAGAAATRIEFKVSRLQSFFIFSRALTNGVPLISLKDVFLQSAYNNTKYQELSNELASIYEQSFGSVSGGEFRNSVFLNQALYAKNLEDYKLRTQGAIDPARHQRLFEIYAELLPIFERLIWKDAEARLDRYRAAVEKSAEAWQGTKLFSRLQKFLHSRWPAEGSSFIVSLTPLPNTKGQISAVRFAQGIAFGVGIEAFNSAEALSPLLFDIAVSLQRNQDEDFRNEIHNYFVGLSSMRHAIVAEDSFAEGLSAALAEQITEEKGQPQGHEVLFAKENKPFVKKLAAMVQEYFTLKRGLDREFVRNYTQLFREAFAEVIFDNTTIYRRVALIGDGNEVDLANFRDRIEHELMPGEISLTSAFAPLNKFFEPGDPRTPIFLLSKNDGTARQATLRVPPWFKRDLEKVSRLRGSAVLRNFDPSGRAYVIIKLNQHTELEKAVERLKSKFPRKNTIDNL